jgi:hypothetical protein
LNFILSAMAAKGAADFLAAPAWLPRLRSEYKKQQPVDRHGLRFVHFALAAAPALNAGGQHPRKPVRSEPMEPDD